MKIIVNIITVVAALLLFIGGASIDSQGSSIPTIMIIVALAWFGMIAWANKSKNPKGES